MTVYNVVLDTWTKCSLQYAKHGNFFFSSLLSISFLSSFPLLAALYLCIILNGHSNMYCYVGKVAH